MSGKAKMRCARCHKPFRASSAKQTLCAECEAKERRARATMKAAPATPAAGAPAAKPKIVGPGASILVPGLVPPAPPAVASPAATPATPRRPEHAAPDHGHGDDHQRAPVTAQGQPGQSYPRPQSRPYPQQQAHSGRGVPGRPQPQQRAWQPRPPAPPRPKKEPVPVITLTSELRERIEARYRELAQPVEFDGIRTRIAAELDVPKSLVKRAVLELRKRDQMPSWWELQGFRGSDEELERIRAAYTPHLPLPAVGVHKQIAADLRLDPGNVYQAIRRIRAELRLPQYNPPEAHAAESQDATAASQDDHAAEATAGVHASAPDPGSSADTSGATAG